MPYTTPHELMLKIRTTMLEKDIKINDIATKLNVSNQNISKILKTENPRLSTLCQICNVLNLNIDISVYEEKEK
jgi:DNA-binding Xre family transcriptional regulator